MADSTVDVLFLIDFGMTSSAGEALRIPSRNSILPIQFYRIGKIPTTIIYDQHGGYKIGERDSDNINIYHNFKSKFPKHSAGSSNLVGAEGEYNTSGLISDYLSLFCSQLLQMLLRKENLVKQQLKAIWYLTTTGCWSESDRLDFQGLAQRVLDILLPGSEVLADITESLTSCEFLVNHLRMEAGNWVIACDIGGCTFDTAVCVTKMVGAKVLPEAYPIKFNAPPPAPDDIKSIYELDKAIMKITSQLNENFWDPSSNFSEPWNDQWPSFRHDFEGDSDFTFSLQSSLATSQPIRVMEASIKDHTITISKSAMEILFERLFKRLASELDMAIERTKQISNDNRKVDLIALCGGGAYMAYLFKYLKLRYKGIPIQKARTLEESRLATLSGHRIYRLRQKKDEFLDTIQLGLSRPSTSDLKTIEWRKNPESITAFFIEKTSPRKPQTHYFLIHIKGDMRPEQFSPITLTGDPGSGDRALVWELEVSRGGARLRRDEYSITVECTGPGRGMFTFQAAGQGHDKRPVELKVAAKPRYCSE
ncbi:hypothetical protein B7494_g7284 [Chlorociboria aeruginascens]|nr:hypothetical protein B7494_g7284 [Chlorociboria aeruginascens]